MRKWLILSINVEIVSLFMVQELGGHPKRFLQMSRRHQTFMVNATIYMCVYIYTHIYIYNVKYLYEMLTTYVYIFQNVLWIKFFSTSYLTFFYVF